MRFLGSINQSGNSAATKLGQKAYISGTGYFGGNSPTVSGSNWTTVRGVFIPYQMQDSTWRLKFSINGDASVGFSSKTLTLNGVTFYNGADQAVNVTQNSNSSQSTSEGYVSSNTSSIAVVFLTGGQTTGVLISGDVELASKPTWAY